MGVALFDLDVTLLDCNSGHLWLRREWKEGRLGVRDAAWAVWMLGQYGLGIGRIDQAFAKAVSSLAGTDEQELARRTTAWFREDVQQRLRPGARVALASHRAAGDRLVLATSGSIYAATDAGRAFGLDEVIGSRFEVVDGRFTGRVAASAFGAEKAARVAEWAAREAVDLSQAAFYTDSAHDLALMERVGRPVAVNPDRVLRRIAGERGWAIVDWGRSA